MPSALQAKTFFLTYPQTPFNFDDNYHGFIEFLNNLGSTSYTCVAIEKHSDGGEHVHCLVDYHSKIRASTSAFDWNSRHPNIKCVGKSKSDYNRVLNYVKKDKNWKEEGSPKFSAKESVWSSIANAQTAEEALSLIKQQQPRDFILNRRNIDYSLSKIFASPESSPYRGRDQSEFLFHSELDEWKSESFM